MKLAKEESARVAAEEETVTLKNMLAAKETVKMALEEEVKKLQKKLATEEKFELAVQEEAAPVKEKSVGAAEEKSKVPAEEEATTEFKEKLSSVNVVTSSHHKDNHEDNNKDNHNTTIAKDEGVSNEITKQSAKNRDSANEEIARGGAWHQQENYKQIGRTSFETNHPTISDRYNDVNTSIATETEKSLDFVVAAFPKTGTSTMMVWLGENKSDNATNIFVPMEEQCQFPGVRGGEIAWGDNKASSLVAGLIAHHNKHPDMKRGIKCPDILETDLFTDIYSVFFKSTDIIVGIRHPVRWFESYYNYRAVVLANHGQYEFPSPNSLMESTMFNGVSGDRANFALPLSKLGKTKLGPGELKLLANMTVVKRIDERKNAVIDYLEMIKSNRPNLGRVFLYDVEQLGDENVARATQFRNDLAAFLKLGNSLPPPGATNTNKDESPYKIDICSDIYTNLRSTLLQHGKEMSEWLLEYFIESDDVFVSDKDFVKNILRAYSEDPCQENLDMQG